MPLFSTLTLLNTLTDDFGLKVLKIENNTLYVKGQGLFKVDDDHDINKIKIEGHQEYRDIVEIANLESMVSDPTKTYRIEFYIESNANADPIFANSLSRKSKTVFVEFNTIDLFYTNLNRFLTMTYGSQLLTLVGELDGSVENGKSFVTSAHKSSENNYLIASNCYIRVMKAEVLMADNFGKFYSIGNLDIYHGSEGAGTQEDIMKNYILPTGYNNRFCTITTKDLPLSGELYDLFIIHYKVNRGNLGVHAVGQQTISETTHCFFIKKSESQLFEDTIEEFIEENTQKEEQEELNGITVKALRYDSDNDEFVETTYTLGDQIPIGSSASTNFLVLTEELMNKLTIVSLTDDVTTSTAEKPSYQWSSMFLEITEQVATSYGIDNSLIGNYLFTAIYSLANGLSKGTVNSAYYVYDGVEYEITCESAEPPVTPKVIATIDVYYNNQEIVGVVTDAETGDSIVILPKSFEVDGIPQPLDAIDTEGYLGAYTFETLGEHTITYELDNPTIIPTSQFNQVNLISVQLVGITSIGNYAFLENPFTNIEIPESVTSIGESAFKGCYNLTNITINATTPPTLGSYAFDDTNNCPIFVPDASVDVYKTAWSGYASRIKPLSSKFFVKLTVQNWTNNDLIGEPREVELQGSGALTSTMIAPYLTLIIDPETGDSSGSCITSMIIGNLCTSIDSFISDDGQTATQDSFLQNIIISDTVTSICASFQWENHSLRNVIIGSGIRNIGGNAFRDCSSLPSITINATTPPGLRENALSGPCTIFVPSESVQAYKTAWSVYADRIQAIS